MTSPNPGPTPAPGPDWASVPTPPPCPCGVAAQPWRTRNAIWSPASFVGGLAVFGFGFGIAGFSAVRPWFGSLVLGLLGLSTLVSWIVQAGRGHRGWCLVRRGVWFGLATPGAPLRLIANSP